jgi:hypothetical protein
LITAGLNPPLPDGVTKYSKHAENKTMKKHVIIFCLIAASCATILPPGVIDVSPLKSFFQLCESDLEKAAKVIVENDMVKNLSHLQRMDNGGNKYYLLEREAITAMIKSVTEGVYSDFILINRDGIVVYTMTNDKLFAGNVKTTLGKTALAACYENRDTSPYIVTVPSLPSDTGCYIAVSSKVKGGNTMPGIFILMVDIQKIHKLIGEKSCIIGSNGNYEVAGDRRVINTHYSDFDKIDLSASYDEVAIRCFSRPSGRNVIYRFFHYSNLLWILVTE